jgi:hypothetical protein
MSKARQAQQSKIGDDTTRPGAGTAAASGNKSRRLVTVGPGGKPRIRPMPPRIPVSELRTPGAPHPRPKLISKKGSPVREHGVCYACTLFGGVRRYEARIVGQVLLCLDCGEKARDETFGRPDALDRAVSGGGFETNRRRH